MISDAERRRLDEIERLLRLQDPAFVRRFDQRTHTPRRSRTVRPPEALCQGSPVVHVPARQQSVHFVRCPCGPYR